MSDDMKKEEEVLVPDTRKKRGRPRKGTDESKKEIYVIRMWTHYGNIK